MSGELSTILGDQIAEIQAEMKTDIRAYNRDPEKRRRHLQLVEQREAALAPSMPAGDWHDGDAATVERARGHANGILGALATEPDGGRDFQHAFEGLPPAVQTVVFSELSRYRGGFASTATPDELTAFAGASPHHAGLVQRWGGSAGSKLGRVIDAFARVEKALPEADRRAFQSWWSRVPARKDAGDVGSAGLMPKLPSHADLGLPKPPHGATPLASRMAEHNRRHKARMKEILSRPIPRPLPVPRKP
jgi:hypothetical protein